MAEMRDAKSGSEAVVEALLSELAAVSVSAVVAVCLAL
jgi:hypothetical protein